MAINYYIYSIFILDKAFYTVIIKSIRGSSMMASSFLHKRNALFCVVLLIVFFAFTADILDLREELQLLPCPYSYLDNNITTGITSYFTFEAEPILILCSAHQKSSIEISFLHLLPYGYRAPPSWS
jgi:hypothetical protein